MKIGQRLEVEWKDITLVTDWTDFSDIDKKLEENKAIRYYTIGFFYSEDKDWLSLCATMTYKKNGEIDELDCIYTIPKSLIMKINKL